jgi:Raf kinase inhibitor-like YbhB/YbcL family protein
MTRRPVSCARTALVVGIFAALVAGACGGEGRSQPAAAQRAGRVGGRSEATTPTPSRRLTVMTQPLVITSPAFPTGATIPGRFTSDGEDTSPPLEIHGAPYGTASYALIVDDPDAPAGTWVHWLVWDIPADTTVIAEGSLPPGAIEGRNSWGNSAYGGPSPPSGTHRYVFTLYALDALVHLPPNADRRRLERAMDGHVLERARLVGLYSRGGR